MDLVIRHTVVHRSSTSIYIYQTALKSEKKLFCGRTDIPTDGHFRPPLMALGRLSVSYRVTSNFVECLYYTNFKSHISVMFEARVTWSGVLMFQGQGHLASEVPKKCTFLVFLGLSPPGSDKL